MFFLLEPERAHSVAMSLLQTVLALPGVKALLHKRFTVTNRLLETEAFGLKFPNPVGLAAGFDKNADYVDELETLGFGFIEIGTVTPKPQPGNPKPRMFRFPADKGIINRMGFNNKGVDYALGNLQKRTSKVIVGGNIGKNKVTPNEDALNDYLINFEILFPVVDYFVVNVSSPNTPGLRDLQDKEPLMRILIALQDENRKKPAPKPILLKIAPDLTNNQLDDIIEIFHETGIDGIIATNTTISRDGLSEPTTEAGGLSGAPLAKRATEVIRYLVSRSNGKIPVVGVGGIFNAADAIEKLEAGAVLVQVFTGFVYEGPGMIARINRGILNHYLKKGKRT